jgi:uncharacterized membrane protein YfcA
MEWPFILLTALIGLVSGIFGGLLGIGGSIIMIPLLTLVHGANQQLYQAAAMIVNIPVAASATIKHARKGVIDAAVVKRLLPTATIGILLGVALSNSISTHALQIVFASFLAYIGITEVLRMLVKNGEKGREHPPEDPEPGKAASGLRRIPFIGAGNGMVAGLLGIGGGVILIPLLKRFCHLELRTAIAASSATMLVTATVGAIYKNLTLPELMAPDGTPLQISDSLVIAATMVPTAFIGSYIGAGLNHRLPISSIKIVFGILVIVAAARMAWMTSHAPASPVTPDGSGSSLEDRTGKTTAP